MYIKNNFPQLDRVQVAIDYFGKGSYQSATKTNYYFRENYVFNDVKTEKKSVTVNDNYIISYEIKDITGNVTG